MVIKGGPENTERVILPHFKLLLHKALVERQKFSSGRPLSLRPVHSNPKALSVVPTYSFQNT